MKIIREATQEDVQGVIADVLVPRKIGLVDKRRHKFFLGLADELDALRAMGIKVVSGQDFSTVFATGLSIPRGDGIESFERDLAQFAGLLRAQRISALLMALAEETPDHDALIGWPGDPALIDGGDLPRLSHETRHVINGADPALAPHPTPVLEYEGALPFILQYLTIQSYRARAEAQAVGTADEVRLAMGQALPDPVLNAEIFRQYALGDNEVALIASSVTSMHATIVGCVSISSVARAFIASLASRGIIG